jgi:antitoxin component YwqK of YwqJK toxin-antitoxin module
MKKVILMIIPALFCGIMFTSCKFRKKEKPTTDRTYWKYSGITGKGKVKNYITTRYDLVSDSVGQLRKADELGFTVTTIEYTESGLWTEYNSKRYSPDSSIVSHMREVIIWDDKGNSLERRDYNLGVLYRKWVFTNDNRGNVLETRRYNATDSITDIFVYRLDKKGNDIEVLRYNGADSLIFKTLRFHNDFGDVLEETVYDSAGNLLTKTTRQYNDRRILAEENVYRSADNSNQKTTYEYKYDFNDNWVESIEYVNDVAIRIRERQLNYYK